MFGFLSQWFLARRELVSLSLSVFYRLFINGPSEARIIGERVVVSLCPGTVHSQEAMAMATAWSILKMELFPAAPG